MNDFIIALIIGASAGAVDVVPMIIQKIDKTACISAFMHWLALGFIIPFVDWGFPYWIEGLILAEITAIPVIIIVAKNDKKAMLPILIFSAILGMAVAWAGMKFIG